MGGRGLKLVNTRGKQSMKAYSLFNKREQVLIKRERQASSNSFVLQNFDQERPQTIEQEKWSALHSVAPIATVARENKAGVSKNKAGVSRVL